MGGLALHIATSQLGQWERPYSSVIVSTGESVFIPYALMEKTLGVANMGDTANMIHGRKDQNILKSPLCNSRRCDATRLSNLLVSSTAWSIEVLHTEDALGRSLDTHPRPR